MASASAVVRVTVPPCRVTPETAGSPSSRRSGEAVNVMVRPATPAFTCAAGAVGDHPAAGDDDHPVGDGVGLVEVVGGEDDGVPAAGQPAHRRPEGPAALDVHGRRRLVEQQQRRRAGQGEREQDALALAAGQRVDRPAEQARRCRRWRPGRPAARQVGKLRRTRSTTSPTRASLGRPPCCSIAPTPPARMASRGLRPSTRIAAGRGAQQAEDGVDDRGLAGPVGTEQGHRGTGGDGQVEAVDGERCRRSGRSVRRCPGRAVGSRVQRVRTARREVVRNVAGAA